MIDPSRDLISPGTSAIILVGWHACSSNELSGVQHHGRYHEDTGATDGTETPSVAKRPDLSRHGRHGNLQRAARPGEAYLAVHSRDALAAPSSEHAASQGHHWYKLSLLMVCRPCKNVHTSLSIYKLYLLMLRQPCKNVHTPLLICILCLQLFRAFSVVDAMPIHK